MNSISEILFILLLFVMIQLLLFIRNKKAKLLLFNLLPSFAISVSLFLSEKGISTPAIELIPYFGIVLYPFTLVLLVADYSPVTKKKHFIIQTATAVPFIIISLILQNVSVILLMHTAMYLILYVSINEKAMNRFYILFFMIVPAFMLFYYQNHFRNTKNLMILLVICSLITSLFIFYEYSKRLHFIHLRLLSINSMNKRLNQVITRLKQNNDTLKKIISQKDIELLQIARHASLAEVTTGIAHELAQPLTGIKCISQNMIDDINYEELDHLQAISDLAKIASLVDRSSSIIDHIRTFSRKRGFSFQQVDLNACILDAIELIKNQINDSGIDLIFLLDDSVPRIYGDNLSLEQLFINFILNAKDAVVSKMEGSSGFKGSVKITTTFNESAVKLIIEDNGSGIPKDVIPKIWTPFFTTKQKGKGTGIGLSLSHRIIKEHNADVSIESSEGGTVFTIKFPLEQPDHED